MFRVLVLCLLFLVGGNAIHVVHTTGILTLVHCMVNEMPMAVCRYTQEEPCGKALIVKGTNAFHPVNNKDKAMCLQNLDGCTVYKESRSFAYEPMYQNLIKKINSNWILDHLRDSPEPDDYDEFYTMTEFLIEDDPQPKHKKCKELAIKDANHLHDFLYPIKK